MEELGITLLSINHRYDDHHRIRFDVMVSGWVPHQQESESCLYAILLFLLLTIISSYMENRERKEKKLRKKKSCSEWEWVRVRGLAVSCASGNSSRAVLARLPPKRHSVWVPWNSKLIIKTPPTQHCIINVNSSHQWFSIPFSIRHKKLLIVSRSHAPSGIFFRSCGNFSSLLVVFLSCLWTVCFYFPSLYFNQWMDSIITEVPLAGY